MLKHFKFEKQPLDKVHKMKFQVVPHKMQGVSLGLGGGREVGLHATAK